MHYAKFKEDSLTVMEVMEKRDVNLRQFSGGLVILLMAPTLVLSGHEIAEFYMDSDWWACKHSYINKIIMLLFNFTIYISISV